MNVSYEYLLKSRQLTWENAEVIDNFFGAVALGVKNENRKEEAYHASYKNTTKGTCINDSLDTEQVCQRGYEETKKNMYVNLDYNEVINVCVALAPLDLNRSIDLRPSNRSFSKGDPPIVSTPSKRSPEDEKIECTICDKIFSRKCDLTRHCCTHSCPQCEKNFVTSSNLKKHLLIHSGLKEFSCNICHKAFAQKSHLTAHHRTHTGDKPYECSECNARFSDKSALKIHMRTHTGETPYQCEICERKFAQLTSLNNHLLIHSGKKPFVCTYANCEKTFRTKGDLQSHIRVHTKEKPYSCLKCHKTFSQSSNCRTHVKKCSVTNC